MTTQQRGALALSIALASDHRVHLEDLKSAILLLLGAWIAYFMVVELFIRTLDRIIVPVLEMPLSALVVAQGCALLFLRALYLLIRCGQDHS
jgi:hypothetical protein